MEDHPDLSALRARLEEEERAYASLLAALDALASLPQPAAQLPELPEQLARLNRLWEAPRAPEGKPIPGEVSKRAGAAHDRPARCHGTRAKYALPHGCFR